jgi:hypothetical protein
MGTLVQFLIKNTGIYNSGLSAVIQGIARLSNTLMLNNSVSDELASTIFNILF